MAVKRIGMLTGGGDVPGLNAVIKSATYRSSENNIEIVGLRRATRDSEPRSLHPRAIFALLRC